MSLGSIDSNYQANERVDTIYFEVTESYYGLNLPEGQYDLLVFANIDGYQNPSAIKLGENS